MAQRVQVLLVCDLHDDETPGEETVAFSLDGAAYEIDLCAAHADQMRDALAGYVGAARRAGGRTTPGASRRRGRPAGAGRSGRDTAAIREWARERGLRVSERGRISADILAQYDTSH